MLNEQTKAFIATNINESPNMLRLRYAGKTIEGVNIPFAIDQIESRRKSARKIPFAVACPDFVFPTLLSSEQCTSEILAVFHAETAGTSGRILDMTCGLGIDAMTFAHNGAKVTACDINPINVEAMKHNIHCLGVENCNVFEADCMQFLADTSDFFDMIFVDPARRGENNKRLFDLKDCSPDIVSNLSLIRKHTNKLMIKASPMLDIDSIIDSLPYLTDLWILSVRNECKEILCLCDFRENDYPVNIHTVNLAPASQREEISFSEALSSHDDYLSSTSELSAGGYIYIPNASLMKVINRVSLTALFPALKKLDHNTHVFYSPDFISDFPGRKLKINQLLQYNKKNLKELKGKSFNIVTRNFPDSPALFAKKAGIKEGGTGYLLGLSINGKPVVIETD